MNMAAMRQYAALRAERDECKTRLDELNKELENLGNVILEEFAAEGVDSIRTEYGTLYTSTALWAGAVQESMPDGSTQGNALRTCQALIEAGYEWLVKPGFNVQQLSAAMRELPRDDNGRPILPKELDGNISITMKPEIRLRKAKNSGKD